MSVTKERLFELATQYLNEGQAEMVEIALDNENIEMASACVAGAISGLRKAGEISDELVLALSTELGHHIPIKDSTHQSSSMLQ